jgi:hypothetical protein
MIKRMTRVPKDENLSIYNFSANWSKLIFLANKIYRKNPSSTLEVMVSPIALKSVVELSLGPTPDVVIIPSRFGLQNWDISSTRLYTTALRSPEHCVRKAQDDEVDTNVGEVSRWASRVWQHIRTWTVLTFQVLGAFATKSCKKNAPIRLVRSARQFVRM